MAVVSRQHQPQRPAKAGLLLFSGTLRRMLGIQTRLRLPPDQDALLITFLDEVSTLTRTAYQHVATGKLTAERKAIYAWAVGQGLTAHQAQAMTAQVEQWGATDQAVLDHRIETLRLRIVALKDAVKALEARLIAPKNATFLSEKASARLKSQRFQKHRSLCNKRQQLDALLTRRQQGDISRVFGSRRLLAQRHRLNEVTSPWTERTWRQEWERKRQGSVTLIGKATHTSGNQSAQVHLETQEDQCGKQFFTGNGVLVLRLTEQQANARLKAAAHQQGITEEKLTGRMAYKRLELPVMFSVKQAEQLARAQALGLPITVTLSRKLTPKGKAQQRGFSRAAQRRKAKPSSLASTSISSALPEIGTYLHVAFDLPTTAPVASRHQGCLGVDVNAWGLSYAAVDAQGQLLHATDPVTGKRAAIKGDIVLPLRGKSAAQAKHCLRQAIVTLVTLAYQHRLAIAIEALDFARKKARLREMPAGYARMLSRLTTVGFTETLASRCRKVGVAHHQVAPAWTSVAGFAKYGASLSLSIDQAAAFAIGRAGVLAKGKADRPLPTHSAAGKKLSPKFIRDLQAKRAQRVLHFQEAVRFAKPLPAQHQRMLDGQSGSTWRHVRKALGRRKGWPDIWARQPTSVTPVPIQEASASRPGGGDTPVVCGRTVRPLATLRRNREAGEAHAYESTDW